MAIPFLNNINLSDNEIQNVKLHVTGTAPTAATGQIYYDSSLNVARYYDNDGWVRLTDTSLTSGTFVSATPSGTNAEKSYAVELSATGTPSTSTFLRGDNTWATVVQENDFLTGLSFNTNDGVLTATVQNQSDVTVDLDGRYALASDIPATIVESVAGGTYITNSGTAADVVLDHDATSRTDTTSTDAPAYGGTFEAVTSVTTNATGHVTAIDVSTVTIPASDNTDVDVSVANLITRLGEISENVTIGDASDVTVIIPGDLQVTGTTTTNNVETVSTSNGVIFEGNAADENELTLLAGTLTSDRTITLPDATGTVALTSDISNNTIEIVAGNALTGGGTFTLNGAADTVTINHEDTSTQASVNNSGRTYIQDITLDDYGHITAIASATETVVNTDNQLATAAALIDVSAMGANTTASFTHGLASKNLIVQMYDTTTGEVVFADIDHTSINAISIIFASTPDNDIRVVVIDAKNGLTDKTVSYS